MARREDSKAQVSMKDFGGFVTNADPHNIPPGTAVRQVNATSMRPGELRTRPGVRIAHFD